MKIKKFLIFFLISIFTFVKIPQAQAQPLPIATTYTQGIYNMTQYTGNYITGKLITANKPLTVIVIDSNGNQKTFLQFNTPNEIVKLGPVGEGDILILVGTGEISFSPL
ncbi:hypothetical protein [Clostridium saccharobutylicum]|uniref:Uncharacterized protein n=1 Tax=Clostridium saccharobutylicum DSM 13864 TaxID=1345695 RepID=U5MQ59_CLOSA|nr:hypothetical protein [Clostridium saccharobutylicum]AGX42658.1 hypothetical protein CLSA_c16610 [Clostridium saccharobutylicum DSM 13864]AQR89947.1 hypothetical protein CLOSC_16540 [Clostridium saccharobutylicum]AQR99852.1 hypothetical protein CSACC_16610 [Clostridium saccharobutylicum]AQS09580.1 hypothetical protein CLOBY_17090 [Clostridium saccharobutylicum]AQS13836.1 hypothetical protein CLOSACC_16610 [Clostridium saccharobutylicum]